MALNNTSYFPAGLPSEVTTTVAREANERSAIGMKPALAEIDYSSAGLPS